MRERPLPDPDRREALTTIARSGRHLLDLINDLLDLSRIRSGRLELHLSQVPLPALLEEIAAMVRVDAESKGLEFVLEAPGDLQALVEADGKRLRQILLNLLGNAIKFTATGQVTLTVQTIALGDERIDLRLWVKDTGVGIAPEDTNRIFSPFEQAEPGRKRESGVGLGLAISQELAHLMGGDIQVESRPGGGSSFCFSVAARRRHPDLIVMDLRMPEMTGFQAAHAIRQTLELATVPIVAASASTADLERAEADSLTFAVCLRKPFESTELLDTIGRLLDVTWHYEEAEMPGTAPMRDQPDAQLVPPSPAVLDELLELARLGKLVRVEQLALELERGELRYRPFARRLYALARDLDEERLIALLQNCAEAQQVVAIH